MVSTPSPLRNIDFCLEWKIDKIHYVPERLLLAEAVEELRQKQTIYWKAINQHFQSNVLSSIEETPFREQFNEK